MLEIQLDKMSEDQLDGRLQHVAFLGPECKINKERRGQGYEPHVFV